MTRGPAKGHGGRPALPTEKVRRHRIRVDMNDGELEAIDEARNEGESRAACVRRLALKAAH